MDTYFGFKLPKGMHKEFADVIQKIAEKQGEVAPDVIMEQFNEHYIEKKEPLHFRKVKIEDMSDSGTNYDTLAKVVFTDHGVEKIAEATGNGPIDSVKNALKKELGLNTKILDYSEHALGEGSDAKAAAYIHVLNLKTGKTAFGVGVSSNITRASVRAVFSALNRLNED